MNINYEGARISYDSNHFYASVSTRKCRELFQEMQKRMCK